MQQAQLTYVKICVSLVLTSSFKNRKLSKKRNVLEILPLLILLQMGETLLLIAKFVLCLSFLMVTAAYSQPGVGGCHMQHGTVIMRNKATSGKLFKISLQMRCRM